MRNDPAEDPPEPDSAPTLQGPATAAGDSDSVSPAEAVQVDSIVSGELVDRLSGRGATFGRYQKKDEVATGGMGSILRVWDEDLRRSLAMKVVLDARGSPQAAEKMLARFVEEAQITGQLEHPGIVPVHEVGLDDSGRMYFTMQLVRGRDLEKILARVHGGKDEEWTQTRAVHALLKVCDAMAYAHSKGVIHRDLKPANIMVGRFGEVYVMDWGLARILGRESLADIRIAESDDMRSIAIHSDRADVRAAEQGSALLTMDGDIMGTPAYMSPEQARGDLDAMGPASDVYSVGAILYHLLAAHPPYSPPDRNLNALAIWGLVNAGAPDPIHERAPDAPAELCAICEKAMARDPSGRYETMQDLARDLRAYLEGRVVAAYETGAVAEFRKWVRRNKALAVTSLVAGVLLVSSLSVAALVLAGKNKQLKTATEQAVQSAALADERATKVLRLSDVKRLQQLRDDADALWPAHPENIAALRDWVARADDLLAREAVHTGELARFEGAAPETTEDLWQRDTLTELTADLDALRDPENGLRAAVLARLAFAEQVEERTRTGDEALRRWAVAAASIADPEQCPAYEGLAIEPQLGLLPIGRDPASGLWEFAHLQTGAAAVRNAESGQLVLTPETGLVFVLIPGGAFLMGSQTHDPDEPNFAADARDTERPLHEVSLDPFFLSKYEMTQGQWLRFTGENPSNYASGQDFLGRVVSDLNPVEQVSLERCVEVLARLGLSVPTEAQWERAARAGTSTPWWSGPARESLRGRVNLADQAAARGGALWKYIDDWPTLDDGYVVHAPVDAFEANPFGLHNVHGNVWEWCRDHYFGDYTPPARPGDGERDTPPSGFRVLRGGSFYHSAAQSRAAFRNPTAPHLSANYIGVRPARRLD
jgi:formylglycine-generating enzyme required for sulfatase activity